MVELFAAELRTDDTALSAEALQAAVSQARILVPTVTDRIDAAVIEAAGPDLKLIANYGAGVDHIDVEAARARGIMVANTPAPVTEDTADMTLALMLAVTRRMGEGARLMQSGEWEGWTPTAMLGGRLGGKLLGILGMGRIGRAVARRAAAFGMRIAYHQRHRLRAETEAELGAVWYESLDQMVAATDVLSLHCPRTPGTFHLVNARRIKLLKPSAVIVNTSRADVVDENALTRALRAGEIAGAGLDVHEQGHGINPRLRALPNVVLLPHMGSATHEARHEMGEAVCLNIQTFLNGHRPPYLLLPDML